ncbi:MAG: UvrD-helicase domain-containing protein [Verrucomicrobiales bacterium]|jgi:DNA helicase-2/ATP-dependent DNA helicase PcrA|nr:UvrD-helicase domain-containing protein [Verrucomicrobiales bacterium]
MSFNYTLKVTPHEAPRIDYQTLLNEEQYAAVSARPGPLLIIAGAGSGKTRTLTYRVAFLVEHGVAPENILLLTFTNKAAKEMLRRVEEVLPHDISRLWGGTFHHVGHRIIRRHADLLGLDHNFNILDRDDVKELISACLAESTVDPKDKKFPKAEILQDIYSLAANTELSVSEVLESHYPYFTEYAIQINAIASAYAARKRLTGGVDYDDLLALTVKLLKDTPELLASYQRKFQHILVDEYQDTNKIQADLIDLLAAEHHQVMVVGDDAQSIYSWRGANFENIMTFPDRHPGTRVIRIETNYRSTPEILNLANITISQNTRQFPKELRAVKHSGVKPALISLDDSHQQAQFVAQRALELKEEGMELSDIAVLYRSHFHSMELQMELTKRNIPFQITSGLRFFEQAHIKDLSAYLRFALNASDEVSFKRIATMLPGVGAKTARKAWESILSGTSWNNVKIPAKAEPLWRQWGETHRQLLEKLNTDTPGHQLQLILDAVYEDFLKSRFTNYNNRMEDLHQLIQFADGFKEPTEFLAQLSLMTNMETEQSMRDQYAEHEALKLSSIHQAKGLEWKAVFVIMLCDGLFPSGRATENADGEEEERRLFYVAVTRAQQELYLLHPQIRSNANYGETWQKPSRFLSDFPRDLCNVWTIKTEKKWGEY